MLAAILIAVKLKLDINYQKIKENKATALVITALYFNNKQHEIMDALLNENKTKLIAALNITNKMDQLNTYQSDAALEEAITKSASYETVTALIVLKYNNLSKHYQDIIDHPELAKPIVELTHGKLHHSQLISILEEKDKINARIKSIHFLDQKQLPQYYTSIINNHELCEAIANVSEESATALITLLKLNQFTESELISLTNNTSLSKAINILSDIGNRFGHNNNHIQTYKELIDNPERVSAVIYAHNLQADPYRISSIASSQVLSKAINLLSTNQGFDKEQLENLCDDSYGSGSTANTIVTLAEAKLDNLAMLYEFVNKSDWSTRETILNILKEYPHNMLTSDMLVDDTKRKALHELRHYPQNICALYLAKLELLDDQSSNALRESLSFRDIIAAILKKNQIGLLNESNMKKLCDQEKFQFHFDLYLLISNEEDPARIQFAIDNINLLEQAKKKDINITTIDQLSAYKAITEILAPEENFTFDIENIRLINRLIKLNIADKTNIQKVLNDPSLRETLKKIESPDKFIAVMNVSKWEFNEENKLMEKDENKLLVKMIACSKTKEQATLFIQLFHLLEDLQIKSNDLQDRKEDKAFQAITKLIKDLNLIMYEFFDTPGSNEPNQKKYSLLKDKCVQSINQAKAELSSHRGGLGVLDTTLTVLASGIVFYPVTYFYQKGKGIQATFFKTKTAQTLNDIDGVLNKLGSSNKKQSPND